ncbi:hypothetical protein AB0F81_21450 [Actinoplanes sp. NPDC024001]|uniref:hypothetical protein n=1 Tax=Actinoplanes sp. NPDC024001 TaxID=3154598 RepID=UPI0033FDA464
MMTPETALLAGTALHFGFQATVTTVVYPALARVDPSGWAAAHRAHTRSITPVVAVTYGVLALICGWALLREPGGWTLTALAATAVAVLVTAATAAPAHHRLGNGYDARHIGRLLRADRVRTAAAAVALTAAAVAA